MCFFNSGGVAGVVKAVNDANTANQQLAEAQRHNKAMEMNDRAKGQGMKRKNIKKLVVKLPHRALTNSDLLKYAKALKIPHFRGVFMRNELSRGGPVRYESGIINLDDKDGPGKNWVS